MITKAGLSKDGSAFFCIFAAVLKGVPLWLRSDPLNLMRIMPP
jgi:hypothetical protein